MGGVVIPMRRVGHGNFDPAIYPGFVVGTDLPEIYRTIDIPLTAMVWRR